jgi:hypothetical protein
MEKPYQGNLNNIFEHKKLLKIGYNRQQVFCENCIGSPYTHGKPLKFIYLFIYLDVNMAEKFVLQM